MCPHCGVLVEAATLTCRFCGYSMHREYEPKARPEDGEAPASIVPRQRAGAETLADY